MNKRKRCSIESLICAALLIFSSASVAGTIKGVVLDKNTKKPVPGAVVTARSGQTEKSELADENGAFTMNDMPAGTYAVDVDYAGAKDRGEVVLADAASVGEVSLAIAESEAKVEVYNISATGSLLGATAKDTAIPLYGVDREENQKKGNPSVLQQVKDMPVGGPVFGDANPFSADAQFRPGALTINIRGLGARRTLVLLNGRRFSPNNLVPADLNLLPASVIGRVEILKDGAATTYGSDALAGVANFFTRQDVDGLELAADYRQVPNSVGDVNATAAFGHMWDGGNLLVGAGYQYRGILSPLDRAWANPTFEQNPAFYTPYNNPGTWVVVGADLDPNNPPALPPGGVIGVGFEGASCTALGGNVRFIPTGPTSFIPACFGTLPQFDLVNEQHQAQLYAELNTKIGKTSKLHLEGLYALTSSPTIKTAGAFPTLNGPGGPGTPFIVPGNNPYFATFLQQSGFQNPAPGFFVPVAAASVLWQPFGLGGAPDGGEIGEHKAYSKNEEIRVSGELSGEVGILDMGYRLGATYIIEQQLGAFPDVIVQRLQRALNGFGGPNCTGTTPGANGCQWLNPFASGVAENASTGAQNTANFIPGNQVSAELARWLNDYERDARWRTDLAVFDALVDGNIPLYLPGGKPTWAIGGQFRRTTSYATVDNPRFNALVTPCSDPNNPTCAVKSGPYVFSSGLTPSFVEQGVYALYGQLDVPAFDWWKNSLSLRFESYGGNIGSTVNPQFRTKLKLFGDLFAIRASVGTAFRGPTPTDTAPGVQITQLAPITVAGGSFKANDIIGNPNLKPEKALTFNVGGIVKVENFNATIDYWFYKIDDQIARTPADLIANQTLLPNAGPLLNCSHPFILDGTVTVGVGGACVPTTSPTQIGSNGRDISRVRSDMVNGPSVTTTGLDIDASYMFKNVFGGELGMGGIASIMLSYKQEDFIYKGINIQPSFDAVGYTNYDRLPGTISRWRGNFYTNYHHGWHNFRIDLIYTDGATDNRGPGVVVAATQSAPTLTNFGVTQGGFISLDAAYQLSLPWDMVFTVSGHNLIGMDPPNARLPFSYDPFIGNPLGRNFKFAISQKF